MELLNSLQSKQFILQNYTLILNCVEFAKSENFLKWVFEQMLDFGGFFFVLNENLVKITKVVIFINTPNKFDFDKKWAI